MDDRTDDPGEFLNHPRWQRFIIAIAGPAMNIILAVGLLTFVYMVHYEYPAVLDEPAVVGWITDDTPAAKAGIQPGDQIVEINGIKNPTWEQVDPIEALSPNQTHPFHLQAWRSDLRKNHQPRSLRPERSRLCRMVRQAAQHAGH